VERWEEDVMQSVREDVNEAREKDLLGWKVAKESF
jgi:hypothetical protein